VSSTATTGEQDIRLGPGALRSDATVADLKAALHAHLKAGRADVAPDESCPRPNAWARKGGLLPARQRIMLR
jgi:hypothetical protein